MKDLLTTRQVQQLLKVDRITIYRMLQDGRLKGIKIGQQWRFPVDEVERLLDPAGSPHDLLLKDAEPAVSGSADGAAARRTLFPVHCAQIIQDMYAGLGQVSAVTVDGAGQPLTDLSQPCDFCRLVQSTPSGLAACHQSWQAGARQAARWFTCHAGLHYQRAAIHENGDPAAFMLSGPVMLEPPSAEALRELARQHSLDEGSLLAAAAQIPLCSEDHRAEMASWPEKYTAAIESILKERAGLVNRLQKIAEISQSGMA